MPLAGLAWPHAYIYVHTSGTFSSLIVPQRDVDSRIVPPRKTTYWTSETIWREFPATSPHSSQAELTVGVSAMQADWVDQNVAADGARDIRGRQLVVQGQAGLIIRR